MKYYDSCYNRIIIIFKSIRYLFDVECASRILFGPIKPIQPRPLFIEVLVPSHDSKRLIVRSIIFASFFNFSIGYFGTVRKLRLFLFKHLFAPFIISPYIITVAIDTNYMPYLCKTTCVLSTVIYWTELSLAKTTIIRLCNSHFEIVAIQI